MCDTEAYLYLYTGIFTGTGMHVHRFRRYRSHDYTLQISNIEISSVEVVLHCLGPGEVSQMLRSHRPDFGRGITVHVCI